MAAAMTMHPPSIRSASTLLASLPNAGALFYTGPGPSSSPKYTCTEVVGNEGTAGQCDGCRRRGSRCAMNIAANKCYSCDFHRQDCVFTPQSSRKRSYPQPTDGTGKKSSHTHSKSRSLLPRGLLSTQMINGNGYDISNTPPSQSPPPAQGISCYRYVRGTANLDPLLLENVPFDEQNETLLRSAKYRKIGNGPGEFVEVSGSLPRVHTRHNNNNSQASLPEGIPPAVVDFLVHSFFKIVHPLFPILDPAAFRISHENRSVEPLLLTAVCVVSAAWLGTTKSMPREVDLSHVETKLLEQLKEALDRPSIPTIQAALLLLQCPGQIPSRLSDQLVSATWDLGLHHDCSNWIIDLNEKRARKRLAWALYAQDKWNALLYGRPAQLTEASWLVKDLSDEDFAGDSDVEDESDAIRNHGATLFRQLLVLSQLLAEILHTFYTLSAEHEVRASSEHGLSVVLQRAKPIQIKLKDWFSNLPASLKMDAAAEEQAACNGILHLAYFATEIALHRCIIRASVAPGTDSYVTYICRSAAKTRLISAMDFVNRLRASHFRYAWPLASVSHFASIGSFGVLLRATAPTSEEVSFYRSRLEEYRWTMAVSSRSAECLRSAIHLLDDNTELLQHIPERPATADFVSQNPHFFQRATGSMNSHNISSQSFSAFSSRSTPTSSDQELEDGESA